MPPLYTEQPPIAHQTLCNNTGLLYQPVCPASATKPPTAMAHTVLSLQQDSINIHVIDCDRICGTLKNDIDCAYLS